MGLGKTCQTIALLVYLRGNLKSNGPFLILCPLSVLGNWKEEMERFAPGLSCVAYTGAKEDRAGLQHELKQEECFHVLLTTYEVCLKDASFLKAFSWQALVVDEAHRLKNQSSLLHKTLSEFSVGFSLLLTGTPIQNSLQELYSLLSFVEPSTFPRDRRDDFVQRYRGVEEDTEPARELRRLLQPFLLRRVKAEVAPELPRKVELVLFHGLSNLQRTVYRAVLMKDLDAFEREMGKKVKLQNILSQLRKCVGHPYLFEGVEPEPFAIGDHLVEASGKLHLLDKLLAFLYAGGHRVLLFSQMTRMLDVLQDYMDYRGYSYERLDGSVRGEERHLAIKNFGQEPVFVFLLSTRAGGVGMNLTAADTVIFVDSDFNPQNDLQATARVHRIGQSKPVKIIRLIGRDTVEEIIYRTAVSKLRLTNAIMEGGHFTLGPLEEPAPSAMQLSEILKFGLDKLLSSEESSGEEADVDLQSILGESVGGSWVVEDVPSAGEESQESEADKHMYLYEGKDYSKEPSVEDRKSFEQLLALQKSLLTESGSPAGPSLRSRGSALPPGLLQRAPKRKRILSPEELADRQRKRQEAAVKRARMLEERKKEKEEAEYKRKLAWWETNRYHSPCLPSDESEEEEEEDAGDPGTPDEFEDEDPDQTGIRYVSGDVTHPQAGEEDAIIVHCVDDSGRWGRGGLFSALEGRSDQPRKTYQLAGEMKDLALGSVLLFPINDKESRNSGQDLLALVVAQHRDRSNNLSGIKMAALEAGLKKIYLAARKRNASVHLPRIGHATAGFNWYGTERLIQKHLAARDTTSRGVEAPPRLLSRLHSWRELCHRDGLRSAALPLSHRCPLSRCGDRGLRGESRERGSRVCAGSWLAQVPNRNFVFPSVASLLHPSVAGRQSLESWESGWASRQSPS
ncbi:chromodomain-helicase-DNA-binding protein 1-like isoform X1 [Tachyglossus aculeatus]|uniref:chromodomain-helicase-DNA-binding protein 1-like isoform X1 n=1 Tax=Tachyglossus aculeatus TaxID=9261 RepID=UPI0018F379FE|nr:chromodomain-helicase-DNA-binding protein 1-like isoform X1 [Tachyglossus aculeatus]